MTRSPTSRPARILIVDDEPINIETLAEALPGYELSFATDGVRALELAVEQPFDLILLDVLMPRMSGFEALRWLKSEARTEHVPVIFVTALDDIRDEARGLTLGAVDYITKPICAPIVRARVRTHLELKRHRDLLAEHAALDSLTGIANRRRFDLELPRTWRSAQREGRCLTLALLDLDHFKQYNDHYGYSAGDEVLARVATALEHAFGRGDDLVARYGGTQFALLLGGDEGPAQLRRALDTVAALEIPHVRSDCSLYVSVSVGAISAHATPDGSPEALAGQAETLLQAAKDGGRNRAEHLDLLSGDRHVLLAPAKPLSATEPR